MLGIARSASLLGIDGHAVTVEVHISSGLPSFSVVGPSVTTRSPALTPESTSTVSPSSVTREDLVSSGLSLTKVRHRPTASKFSNANPSGLITE